MNALQDVFERRARLKALGDLVKAGGRSKWNALREIYKIQDDHIRGVWPRPYSPYLAWSHMSPIEVNAWNAIRRFSLPFYPQYPVGKFFVDFGDPVARLAIECDGKKWHDAKRDAERDAQLGEHGWTVKRFTGRQCVLPEDHEESIDAWLLQLSKSYGWQADTDR